MAKRLIPREVADEWLAPLLTDRAIRRDLTKYLLAGAKDSGVMVAAAEGLRGFERPTLAVWAAEDHVIPQENGQRLAELLPHGRLLGVPTATPPIPED
jgi:pimeloyl-ACP methyl ester carboxylesterase